MFLIENNAAPHKAFCLKFEHATAPRRKTPYFSQKSLNAVWLCFFSFHCHFEKK
ncbi:hypothetical protein ATPR_2751 [Acetobacter tropicalis NBRC 101654]|uniref:Uncharacterized protein n=1 Tax=Acetobacter tropicalis NBRC 101654 TaxID=749388 RepID=F7VHA2_9PROT|nr:hypothetical protein ATPR_2751 [Acetobacter tropicalis NBRC 101654]